MRALRRVTRALAATLALASVSRPGAAAPPRFELEPKLGYAAALTTGLSPYGVFTGAGVGARPAARLWLHASLFSYAGTRAAGDGPGVSYRAHDRAYALALDATWRFDMRSFFVAPGLELGAAWIVGSTYATPAQISDRYVAGNVGPVLRIALRFGRVALGAEGAALFVPSDVAAPVLRVGASAVLPF